MLATMAFEQVGQIWLLKLSWNTLLTEQDIGRWPLNTAVDTLFSIASAGLGMGHSGLLKIHGPVAGPQRSM